MNWRDLQEIILKKFSDLKQLTIKFRHDMKASEAFEDTRKYVKVQLSRLDAKGALRFDWVGLDKPDVFDMDIGMSFQLIILLVQFS